MSEAARQPEFPPKPDGRRWLWNPAQCRAIGVVLLAGTAGVAALWWQRPVTVTDPQPAYPARFDELADRLDPNTASAAELATLPGIGPSKADAIVAHRNAQPPGRVAFRGMDDMSRVHGIGPALTERMRPYLTFPAAETATGDR